MKSTILNLNKRVLVVDMPRLADYEVFKHGIYFQFENGDRDFIDGKFDLICKGSELSEEILKTLIEPKRISSSEGEIFPDYKNKGWLYGKPNRIKSFISAIEANEKETGIKINLENSIIFEML